jgi:hypothetical protein
LLGSFYWWRRQRQHTFEEGCSTVLQ